MRKMTLMKFNFFREEAPLGNNVSLNTSAKELNRRYGAKCKFIHKSEVYILNKKIDIYKLRMKRDIL